MKICKKCGGEFETNLDQKLYYSPDCRVSRQNHDNYMRSRGERILKAQERQRKNNV